MVYINGKKVMEHTCGATLVIPAEIWDTPFMLKARQHLQPNAENVIVVQVYNRLAMGGIWKPVYLISTDTEQPTSVYQEEIKNSELRKLTVAEEQIFRWEAKRPFNSDYSPNTDS